MGNNKKVSSARQKYSFREEEPKKNLTNVEATALLRKVQNDQYIEETSQKINKYLMTANNRNLPKDARLKAHENAQKVFRSITSTKILDAVVHRVKSLQEQNKKEQDER